ncbi:MAG: XRE family transcriptional regulator [Planctomycetia bacterium]|nr:XRE family transcriptional regulator [Planctomycetia bacterium]
MASTVNLSDLGRRVRVARLARRMTLEDVVSRTEFTVSWLSKLENGQLSPSLEGLVRLADVLECGVDTLVAGLSVPPQYVVVKRGCGRIDQRRTSDGGIVAECLADQWRNRAMDPVILRVTAAGNRRHPDNHDGERFLLVLDGAVEVAYGDETIELAAGDSMYIYAAIPHTLHATGRGEARVLSVSYDQPQAGRRAPRRN